MKFGNLFLILVFRFHSSKPDVSRHPHYVYQLLVYGVTFKTLVLFQVMLISCLRAQLEMGRMPVCRIGNAVCQFAHPDLNGMPLFLRIKETALIGWAGQSFQMQSSPERNLHNFFWSVSRLAQNMLFAAQIS